jgi:large subunit ribosomal protein L25
VGEAPGVKEGGVLEHPLFTIHVRCLPMNVPESIDADISGLNIGDSLRVSELSEGRDFHILNDPESVVASVAAPISEEQLEAMVAEAGAEGEEAAPAEAAAAEGEEAPADEAAASEEAPAEDADQS